jgi:hypothetical protein
MWARVTRFDPVRGLLIAFAGIMIALSPCGISTDGALTVGVSDASANPGVADTGEFDELPSVESLLQRYVEAVGGREAILALRTRVASMHIVTDLSWDPPIYEVDTLSVYGTSSGEFLVITRTPRGVMLEGCDGDEEWKIDLAGTVFNFVAADARDRWMTDPQFPLKMRHYFPHMAVVGLDVWGGDRVFVVETDGEELHRLGFDVDTGLLTRLGYNRELHDYEVVDGVTMPHRVVYSRKGGSSTFVVDSVVHNTTIDRNLFSLAK